MAVDMFLKMEGIDGESEDSAHKKWVDVLAWSWGVSQSGSMHMSGGGGSGKANFQDLSVTGYYDSSTPKLMQNCSTGKHFAKAELVVRKAGGEQLEYIKYTLSEVIVTSVSTGGSGGEDRLTCNYSLNFAKLETIYKAQDTKGAVGADIKFGYDIRENTDLS